MPRPAPQLDYSPRPLPWHRSRRVRAWVMLGVLVTVGVSAYRWAPPLRERVGLLYTQHLCLNYAAPASQIVYDERPPSAMRPREAEAWYTHGTLGDHPFDGDAPLPWHQFPVAKGRYDALLFLHERTSPAGHRRLVAVELRDVLHRGLGSSAGMWRTRTPVPVVIQPGSLTRPPGTGPASTSARRGRSCSWRFRGCDGTGAACSARSSPPPRHSPPKGKVGGSGSIRA